VRFHACIVALIMAWSANPFFETLTMAPLGAAASRSSRASPTVGRVSEPGRVRCLVVVSASH
jgi:hypothetical protein